MADGAPWRKWPPPTCLGTEAHNYRGGITVIIVHEPTMLWNDPTRRQYLGTDSPKVFERSFGLPALVQREARFRVYMATINDYPAQQTHCKNMVPKVNSIFIRSTGVNKT